jgi:hypothetical protein
MYVLFLYTSQIPERVRHRRGDFGQEKGKMVIDEDSLQVVAPGFSGHGGRILSLHHDLTRADGLVQQVMKYVA